jgi:hypothetical protein
LKDVSDGLEVDRWMMQVEMLDGGKGRRELAMVGGRSYYMDTAKALTCGHQLHQKINPRLLHPNDVEVAVH